MQVLIGTKSLLGEGWDSPCINSLILASFVGSFMLSNQMRGRAIRVWKEDPNKTSNIWHLVCLKPRKEVQQNPEDTISEDYTLLCRRMEQFLGLHYTEDTIENGIDRLSIIRSPFTKSNAASMNRKMLALSQKRSELKDRWMRSLAVYDKMEVVNTNEIPDKYVTSVLFWDALRALLLTSALLLVGLIFALGTGFASRSAVSGVIGFFHGSVCRRRPAHSLSKAFHARKPTAPSQGIRKWHFESIGDTKPFRRAALQSRIWYFWF